MSMTMIKVNLFYFIVINYLGVVAHELVKKIFIYLLLLLSNAVRSNKFLYNISAITPINKNHKQILF